MAEVFDSELSNYLADDLKECLECEALCENDYCSYGCFKSSQR